MTKQQFYQWLDTVCDWMLLTEKPVTCHKSSKLKKLKPEENGAPVVLRLHEKPQVCRICSVVTDTGQLFNCRRNLQNKEWTLSCNRCKKSYTKTADGYVNTARPRRTPGKP